MVDLLTFGGVILIFLVLISPIISIILEEINKMKGKNNKRA